MSLGPQSSLHASPCPDSQLLARSLLTDTGLHYCYQGSFKTSRPQGLHSPYLRMPDLANKTMGLPVNFEFWINNEWLLFSSNQPPALCQYVLLKVEIEDQDIQTSPVEAGLDTAHPSCYVNGRKIRERKPLLCLWHLKTMWPPPLEERAQSIPWNPAWLKVSLCLIGTEFQFGMMKKFYRWVVVMVAQQCKWT